MHLTARMTTFVCAVFALVCSGFVLKGFLALPSIQDQAEHELAQGYAGFWLFLLIIAVVFGVLSHLMARGHFGPLDDA